jgi:predicted peptidase
MKTGNMNRACFTKNTNLHEQNQHASSPARAGQAIRPLKNNFVRMKKQVLLIGCFILLGSLNSVQSQHTEQKFTKDMRYLFYLPDTYGKDTIVKWPLILFLHGGGERGDDLSKVKANGPPRLIARGKKLPFIVVSPQIPLGELWDPDLLVWMLKDIIKNYRVDKERIYLTGLSIGGLGTWETAQKYPEMFAAIAPVSGWGDPLQVWKIRHTPVWIFHGAKDPVVPVVASRVMADSLEQYDNVKLTIYPNGGHDRWNETYDNAKLYEWFLDHKRFRFDQTDSKDLPEKYTGIFSSDNDTASIFQIDNKLRIRYGYRGSKESLLKPTSGNTFFLHENELTEIRYFKNNDGVLTSFIFYDNSRKLYNRIK